MKKILTTSVFLGALALTSAMTFAAENPSTPHIINPTGGTPMTGTTTVAGLQAYGDAAIAKRIASMAELQTKLTSLSHISVADKANVTNTIASTTASLQALKVKIDGESDIPTLKTDVASIFNAYRVYMLLDPQLAGMTRIDIRMADIATTSASTTSSLQARIAAASAAGKDVTTVNATFATYQASITASQASFQAALNKISPLKPDYGDKTILASNKQALEDSKTLRVTGLEQLKAAHAAARLANKELKALGF